MFCFRDTGAASTGYLGYVLVELGTIQMIAFVYSASI